MTEMAQPATLNLRTEIRLLRTMISENSRLLAHALKEAALGYTSGNQSYNMPNPYLFSGYFDGYPLINTPISGGPPQRPKRGSQVASNYWRRFIEHLQAQQACYHQRLNQLNADERYAGLKGERAHLEMTIQECEVRVGELRAAVDRHSAAWRAIQSEDLPPPPKRAKVTMDDNPVGEMALVDRVMGVVAIPNGDTDQSLHEPPELQALRSEYNAEVMKIQQLITEWRRNQDATDRLCSPPEGAINLSDFITGHQCSVAANSIHS